MSTAAATLDIVDTLASAQSFSTFLKALEQSGVTEELRAAGPFTVFAPTDMAFNRIPPNTLRDLMKSGNEELLYDIMSYHVVPGEVHADSLQPGQNFTTLGGQHLSSCKDQAGAICLDRSHIIQADVACVNGILHAVDKVLLPGNRD